MLFGGGEIINRKRNNNFRKLVICGIIFIFCLATINISAQNLKKDSNETREIKITKSDLKLEKESIGIKLEEKNFKKFSEFSEINSITASSDVDVLLTEAYNGHPAVVSDESGNAVFFIETQDPDNPSLREIAAVPSTDSGATWNYDFGGFFPSSGGYNEFPSLDFRSASTAYGTWISADFPGMTSMARLDDISNPDAGEGWGYWDPDWVENGLDCGPMYSTDVACYDGPLNEEPDVFWGIASWTGKLDDPEYGQFENGIFLNYFAEEYIYVSWFPDIEGVYRIVSDIDQSTGVIYWTYEVYNEETGVNDLWLMYITMQDWFADESFSIWQIDGPARNPAITAGDGVLNVAFESEGDLICLYSNDNAENVEFSFIVESEEDELYPDIINSGSNAICVFNKNNDIYYAKTENGGVNWSVESEKINDVAGAALDEYQCINLLPNRAFWTDTRSSEGDVYSDTLLNPPEKPTISGPSSGKPNREYDFTVTTTDSDGDQVWYLVEWGDDSDTGWVGPYSSGSGATLSHTWDTEDTFNIKAKAKNSKGAESDWATLEFSTPKAKGFFRHIFDYFDILEIIWNLLKI